MDVPNKNEIGVDTFFATVTRAFISYKYKNH